MLKKLSGSYTSLGKGAKSVVIICVLGMLMALSIIISAFSIDIGDIVKIGFANLITESVGYLFGPAISGIFAASKDVLGFFIESSGRAFFPGWTISAFVAGTIYGLMLYKQKPTIVRILITNLIVTVLVNMFLGSLWVMLTTTSDKGFIVILGTRVVKNLIKWPIDSMLFYMLAKSLNVIKDRILI